VVEGLFFAIYGALVYGFAEGKLPNLSPDLEQMIEFLMPAGKSSSFSFVVCLSCSSLNPPPQVERVESTTVSSS
jgi:hypothetical protein